MEFSKEKDVVEVSPTEEVVLYDDVKVKFNSVSGRKGGGPEYRTDLQI